ncbi:SUKH-3 domain-containing protein [Pectobacterium polaris]|uniref:SUKH-3 domain-containing protein n=1 Tax=Pectobacterium polaris TaxID=2042057 RepID=UPI00215B0503|nr:SUKH-3 domain-containing protein [Pectobacterium polaris]
MSIEIPKSVLPLFHAAGWPRTEAQSVPPFVPENHPASAILLAFSGLTVGECDAGEECATSDIVFGGKEGLQQDETLLEWQRILDTTLILVGETHHAHGALLMDNVGVCYGMSFVDDSFWFEGASFGVAVERILLGRRGKEMRRPD